MSKHQDLKAHESQVATHQLKPALTSVGNCRAEISEPVNSMRVSVGAEVVSSLAKSVSQILVDVSMCN